jgi:hypothetical protein
MAESDLIKALNDQSKQAKEDSARQVSKITELLEQGKGDKKQRVELMKMQRDLDKTSRGLSDDLGKNITDMKDGFMTSVDGMINQTFGPLGGMVTSLSTGFFKRGKENRENVVQNQLQNEKAQELIETMGGVRAAVQSLDKKTAPRDLDSENAGKSKVDDIFAGVGIKSEAKPVTEGGVVDKVFDGLTTAAGVGGGVGGVAAIKALGGKYKALVGKLTGGVAGKVLSKANPVFAAITMGKDIFDVAHAVTDDDVRTSVKAEDIGGLIGGFIGGAVGIFGGPAGVALGVGLGNMAGEFIGKAFQTPEIIGAIAQATGNLEGEKVALAAELLQVEADAKAATDPKQKEIFEKQKTQIIARQKIVDDELDKIKDKKGDLQKELKKLTEMGAAADENRKKSYELESQITEARSRGDKAMVTRLEGRLTILDTAFEQQEKDYQIQAEKLRVVTTKTTATMAEKNTNFFDRMATEGGVMGTLLSGFGLFGTEMNADAKKLYLMDKAKKELAELDERLAMVESKKLNPNVTKEYAQMNKDRAVAFYKTKRDAKIDEINALGMAKGGFIVNKPTYLPNSGIVVGEHGTYSGNGAAYGGIADGGPEAVIPLGSTRAGAFIDPMAQSIAGQIMNRLQMERMSGGSAGMEGASVVTGNDMSSSQVNNNTTVVNNPSPIGQTLPDEGRDFVSKIG